MGFHLAAGMLTTVEYSQLGTAPSATGDSIRNGCPAAGGGGRGGETGDPGSGSQAGWAIVVAVLGTEVLVMSFLTMRDRRRRQGNLPFKGGRLLSPQEVLRDEGSSTELPARSAEAGPAGGV